MRAAVYRARDRPCIFTTSRWSSLLLQWTAPRPILQFRPLQQGSPRRNHARTGAGCGRDTVRADGNIAASNGRSEFVGGLHISRRRGSGHTLDAEATSCLKPYCCRTNISMVFAAKTTALSVANGAKSVKSPPVPSNKGFHPHRTNAAAAGHVVGGSQFTRRLSQKREKRRLAQ